MNGRSEVVFSIVVSLCQLYYPAQSETVSYCYRKCQYAGFVPNMAFMDFHILCTQLRKNKRMEKGEGGREGGRRGEDGRDEGEEEKRQIERETLDVGKPC